ncbi:DUF3488 domain-containing protein [bacterium]|nr:DUF3488 domain-containing protein [bacterium]
MQVVSLFKISLYALTALAAWMLGSAENGWIPYITLPVLIAAYLVIESKPGRSLPPGPANFLGALAVAAAAWEFSFPDKEAKLLSGAHLLVYATWIVMFQEKTYRMYWWVMGLGVLQVAVASVLSPGPWFGLYLVVYICGALWTMSIASLYQVQQLYGSGQVGWQWETPLTNGHSPSGEIASIMVLPAVQHDESQQWLSRRFFGGMLILTSMSVGVSAAFFAFTPRVWFGPQNIFGDETIEGLTDRKSTTGFAREVRLGELGEILESLEPVFSVTCVDALTEEPVTLEALSQRLGMEEPYFRGAVMTEYERGNWYPERNDQPVRMSRIFNKPGIRQEVVMEPTVEEVLFCVGTPAAAEMLSRREDIFLHLSTGIMVRETRPESRERVHYISYVEPISEELRRVRGTPVARGLWWQNIERSYLRRTQFFDQRRFPVLTALGQQLAKDLQNQLGHEPTPYEIAQHFEYYLRDSGGFGYTLNLSVVDPSIDPVEDFLQNRKEGHCEYFASTLTLLLRSVGIPARLVSGFKGGDYNQLRGVWEVKECHAHAWVEAWTGNDVWITLDPTPGLARQETIADVSSKIGFWGKLRSSSSMMWEDYVVNINLQRQKQSLYRPLQEFFSKLVALSKRVFGSWESFWNSLVYVATHPSEWLSITGGILTFVLLLSSFLFVRFCQWLWKFLTDSGFRLSWWEASQPMPLAVVFYERFLKSLKKLGIQRAPSETPLEFAQSLEERFRTITPDGALRELPERVSRAFYSVRYGGEELPPTERDWLEQQLAQLEAVVQPRHKPAPA